MVNINTTNSIKASAIKKVEEIAKDVAHAVEGAVEHVGNEIKSAAKHIEATVEKHVEASEHPLSVAANAEPVAKPVE